jgi:NADH-quinone oxidoreductase subunit N
MSYLELLRLAAPETIIVAAALAVLGVDLLALRGVETRLRFTIGGLVATLGCVVAIAWMLVMPEHAVAAGGIFVVDPLTQFVKVALLALTVLTIWISTDSTFTAHVGEFFALILLAVVGMMFLVSAEDILMIFVALELTSLSLYILTAFNKRDVKSTEAALKYFLFGSMAAAFLLFGLSYIYGLTGSTNLHQIAAALAGKGLDPLLVVAMIMVIIGFGFKVAAVPFHLWAPDAYQGAPAPSAAFIASGSKVASFFILAKIMMLGFPDAGGSGAWHNYVAGWIPALAIIAGLSMVLGNLVAIVQSSVRRLLAYSAIAHAGYMLLAVLAPGSQSFASLLYYAVTYAVTTIGAFGVVAIVEGAAGDDRLTSFAGLSRRAPVASFCMFIFMLSLAGIPPLAGFFGKFYVFAAVVKASGANLGLLWLVIIAIAMSAVSLYYYLLVLKQVYVAAPAAEGRLEVSPAMTAALVMCAALTMLLGCFPDLLISKLVEVIQLAGL